MKIALRCISYPTEDKQRIETALENILGPISVSMTQFDEFTEIYSSDLTESSIKILRQLIHEKRIIDAARVRLLKNLDELTTSLYFDKQAAYHGKLRLIDNIHETPPLGSIELTIDFNSQPDFENFLDWFAPRTKDGRIIT